MPSDLNLASPNTEVTLTIGSAFSTTAEIVAEEASISTSGVVLSIENTPVPVAPSTILVDEAQDISVEISNPSTTNVIEIAPADLPEIFVDAIEVPSIVVYDSTSLVFNLVDLDDIVGDPQDGDIIIYDGDTNTFIFDQNPGQGGAFSTDVEVTNNELAMGDALGMTYEEGSSIQGAIRDILTPVKPAIVDYKLNFSCQQTITSSYVVPGSIFSVDSIQLYFDRYESLVEGSIISAYKDDILLGHSLPITSDKSPRVNIPNSGALFWDSGTNSDYIEIRVPYNQDGQYYSKRLPIYSVSPVSMFVTNQTDESILAMGSEAFVILRMQQGRDHDGGHFLSRRYAELNGSTHTEDPRYHLILSIPSEYELDSIVETVGGSGAADMTNSFYRINDEPITVFPNNSGVDEFDVYLYRSNQTGALKEKSSLRVNVL